MVSIIRDLLEVLDDNRKRFTLRGVLCLSGDTHSVLVDKLTSSMPNTLFELGHHHSLILPCSCRIL